MATKLTQMRLNDDDRRKLELIRSRYGLASNTEAVRYALNEQYRRVLSEPAAVTPKTPARSKAR